MNTTTTERSAAPPTQPPAASRPEAALPDLSAVDLACRRGNRILFKGVNLRVRSGEATWLRGRNGCGKTSLLRLMVGLAVPEAGNVLWGDVPIRKSNAFAGKCVYVAHTNALKDDLTVAESLQFLARVHGRDSHDDALLAALQRVGMGGRRNGIVRTFSQGQRRRAALARLALEKSAALWVLDEPYDALDADGIGSVNELLREHLARGGSVLLTSHLPPGAGAPPMIEFDLGQFA
jgi:heme exporter protein A